MEDGKVCLRQIKEKGEKKKPDNPQALCGSILNLLFWTIFLKKQMVCDKEPTETV